MVLSVLLLMLCTWAAAQQEKTFTPIPPREPLPLHVQQLLHVAIGELGYTEGSGGQTKYGAWYGNPTAEWCAEFLCWSVAQVEKNLDVSLLNVQFPLYGATNIGRNWFLKQSRYIARTGFVTNWGTQWYKGEHIPMEKNSYIPQPGDWVFFSYTPTGDTTHVALVELCLEDENNQVWVQVIEGNMPDKVQRALYKLDDWRIQGYGTVRELAGIVLRGGVESMQVKALQEQLVVIGLLNAGEENGVYNHRTQEAIRSFQAMRLLPQTGIANQQTQLELSEYAFNYMMAHTEFWTVNGAY
jgi:hypothetical protein